MRVEENESTAAARAGAGVAPRRPRSDRQIATPKNGFALNIISLLGGASVHEDLELDSDGPGNDSAGRSSGRRSGRGSRDALTSAARQVPTTDLLVPWNPDEASENHIVFETYNAHAVLHSVATAHQAQKVPILLVRTKSFLIFWSFLLCCGFFFFFGGHLCHWHLRYLSSESLSVSVTLWLKVHQMYSIVGDRTAVDREVDELSRRGVFRVLRATAQ